jgi:peroxiredoxin
MSATVAAPATASRGKNALGTLIVLAVTAVIIIAAAYLSDPGRAADAAGADGGVTAVNVSGTATGAAPTIDQPAPDFTAAAADGSSLTLSQFVGRPVWLTFGASWCQPCRAENPDVETAYRQLTSNAVVVQVYMDEDAAAVTDYAQRVGITYLTVPDPNERLAAEYRILGIPSHFFIDASGVLCQIKVGSLDLTSMQAALADIGG